MIKSILLKTLLSFLSGSCLFLFSCTSLENRIENQKLEFEALDIPASGPSFCPNISQGGDRLLMSWVEDTDDTTSLLKIAFWDNESWSDPREIAQGSNWFVNWADFPATARSKDGRMAAHYLSKVGEGTYSYGIFVVGSDTDGHSWKLLGSPHIDRSETEHGFMSMFPFQEGLGMVWLDGRQYAGELKQMELRFNTLDSGQNFGEELLLDERVCDCCQTGAVATESGAVVVYRDRSEEDIRDIYRVVLKDGEWSKPAPVFEDGWKIGGCPVNGPAIDAVDDEVVVGWFSNVKKSPEVKVAFSDDGGFSFGQPIRVDIGKPEGRTDILMTKDGYAWVSWMENYETGAEILLRAVFPNAYMGPVHRVAPIHASRSSGFPILIEYNNQLFVALTIPGETSKIQLMRASVL